jgi:hypothetical protein
MALPQIPNGFKFRPIFPLSSPPQNETSPSCIPNFEPSTPIIVSFDNDKGKIVVDDVTGKNQEKKRRKMYDGV